MCYVVMGFFMCLVRRSFFISVFRPRLVYVVVYFFMCVRRSFVRALCIHRPCVRQFVRPLCMYVRLDVFRYVVMYDVHYFVTRLVRP